MHRKCERVLTAGRRTPKLKRVNSSSHGLHGRRGRYRHGPLHQDWQQCTSKSSIHASTLGTRSIHGCGCWTGQLSAEQVLPGLEGGGGATTVPGASPGRQQEGVRRLNATAAALN